MRGSCGRARRAACGAPGRPGARELPADAAAGGPRPAADFARINRHRWYASPSGGKMYARRNTKTGTILMHREIVHAPKGVVVDHKDRNGLNNRPENLRPCTPAQNQYNEGPRGKKSRFKGVYPDGDKWYAMIKHKGVTYYCGRHDSEIEAAKVRDRKARELEGECAYVNVPGEGDGPRSVEPPAGEGQDAAPAPAVAEAPPRRWKRRRKRAGSVHKTRVKRRPR